MASFLSASTHNLPDFWQAEASQSHEGALTGVVSIPLARKIVSHFGNRLFSESLDEYESSVSLFTSRCLNDYGILEPFDDREQHMFKAQPEMLAREFTHLKEERSYILPYIQRQAGEIADQQKDIAALVILGGSQADASIYQSNKRKVIETFIQQAAHHEQFKVLRYYWNFMVGEVDQDQNEAELELFRMLDTAILQELVLAFRRAGMYEKTALCYRFLQAIYPVESRIGQAVVLSEQGKYHESVEHFLATEADWMGDLSGKTDGHGSTDIHARLSLHLFMCVVIVMNRLEKYKELGDKSLGLIGKFLMQMGDGERNNHQLTRYYNVLASYHEWEGDYAKAIETYEKGLSIPGVDRSLISSLMVNEGIAYRMLGKEKAGSKEAQMLLRQAIRYNKEGADAKDIIGNVDQLPIALHNLAESYLELAFQVEDIQERSEMLQAAKLQAKTGLNINRDIKSSKKKGQLLVERFIAEKGLADIHEQKPSPLSTEDLLTWIEENQDASGYDIDVVLDLLQRLGQWQGSNMAEAAQWLRKHFLE